MAAATRQREPADAYDLLIIGGGINGTGIARDAAGRGLSVLLAERGDLAGFTSSSVDQADPRRPALPRILRVPPGPRSAWPSASGCCGSRPHIIWPLRFVLPHDEGLRPAWMLRLGLFLYDHLARLRTLPGSKAVDLRSSPSARRCRSG